MEDSLSASQPPHPSNRCTQSLIDLHKCNAAIREMVKHVSEERKGDEETTATEVAITY